MNKEINVINPTQWEDKKMKCKHKNGKWYIMVSANDKGIYCIRFNKWYFFEYQELSYY